MIGAMMFLKGEWKNPGVNNVEDFNPDPFMEQLNKQGLPWVEVSTEIWNFKIKSLEGNNIISLFFYLYA